MSDNTTGSKPGFRERMTGKANPNRQLAEDAVLSGWGSVVLYLFAVGAVAFALVYFGQAIFNQTGSMAASVGIPLAVAAGVGGLVFLYKVVLRD